MGFCATVFLRVVDEQNEIKLYLLIAKSCVAPLKHVSLPRLELCAAYLLSKLLQYATTQLSIEQVFGWSDSTVTLAWICTPAYRLKTFMANCVAEIQDMATLIIWSHIPSEQNPADCDS